MADNSEKLQQKVKKMGWTFYNIDKNTKTKDECRKEINENKNFRVIKDAMIGSVYYAAVAKIPGMTVCSFAVVFLTRRKSSFGQVEFGYKAMEETVGPRESNCPTSILDLLTSTDNQWAREWRQRCRDNEAIL